MKTAVAYYRTSSITNCGQDKDSLVRQRDAVVGFASVHGIEIVREFYDAAVSGADPVDARPGFAAMLAYMLSNGARTIIVENASRFARDLMVQETGYHMLKARGIELLAADSPDSFLIDTPTAVFVRQVLGAAAQMEKAMLVQKLRGARDRRSAQLGRRVEGNPLWRPAERTVIETAKTMRRAGMSLRAIADCLAPNPATGRKYTAQGIKHLLGK